MLLKKRREALLKQHLSTLRLTLLLKKLLS
jgi:hypothetical protein